MTNREWLEREDDEVYATTIVEKCCCCYYREKKHYKADCDYDCYKGRLLWLKEEHDFSEEWE